MTVTRVLAMFMSVGCSGITLATDLDSAADLARWQGGSLTRAEFVADSDPDETLLRNGGPDLVKAVCKASYRAIYGNEALRKGFDHDPDFLDEMDRWRTKNLASTYVQRARRLLDPTADDVRAFYHQRLQELYTSSETANLEILFVRCEDSNKDGCGERMATYRDQIDSGGDLSELIKIEKEHSGDANGMFPSVPLDRLAPELAEAVQTTPDGWLTPVVDTPRGQFLIRVHALTPPATIPFEQAERHVRQVMRQERESKWLVDEARRLRTEFGETIGAEVADNQVFAAAARQAHLHLEAAFLQAERQHYRWSLADFAFFRDPQMLPSDEEIEYRLAEDQTIVKRFEQRNLLILVVPATSDREETLAISDHVLAAFESSSSANITAKKLLEENSSLISMNLDGVTRRELDRVSQSVSEKATVLASDQWAGPLAFRTGLQVSDDLVVEGNRNSIPAGIGFIVVLDVITPGLEEVRKYFYRQARDAITTTDAFVKAMNRRWDFELLLEGDK